MEKAVRIFLAALAGGLAGYLTAAGAVAWIDSWIAEFDREEAAERATWADAFGPAGLT